MLDAYLNAGIVIGFMVVGLWLLSLKLRDTSVIDPFWSLFFVAATLCGAFGVENLGVAHWLFAGLVLVWGLRLALFLFIRNHGKGEDYRYAAWRKQHADVWWWRSFFTVFLLQGVLAWLLCIPFVAVFYGDGAVFHGLHLMGVLFWVIGFVFEAGGDWQLERFKKQRSSQSELLDTGLWRYTRHPNYFGESAMWWGFFCFALGAGYGWTIYAPILMTLMLLKVSGVSLLEQNLKTTKPKYADYVARTSAFVPMPPK